MRGYANTSRSEWNTSFLPCRAHARICQYLPDSVEYLLFWLQATFEDLVLNTFCVDNVLHELCTAMSHQTQQEARRRLETPQWSAGRVVNCLVSCFRTNSSKYTEKRVSCKCNFSNQSRIASFSTKTSANF